MLAHVSVALHIVLYKCEYCILLLLINIIIIVWSNIIEQYAAKWAINYIFNISGVEPAGEGFIYPP